jgi:hypothetical protein
MSGNIFSLKNWPPCLTAACLLKKDIIRPNEFESLKLDMITMYENLLQNRIILTHF